MSVQSFLYAIDGISTWVGKAAAWLIVALMSVVCIEVFKLIFDSCEGRVGRKLL